jgi:hypothetical protein
MERTKKRCPYCGEEIMAVAKKCKHCNSWLEEHAQPLRTSNEIQKRPSTSTNTPWKINRTHIIIGAVAILAIIGGIYWISNDRSAHEPTKTTASPTASDPYDASNDTFDQWLGHFTIESAVYRACDTKCYLDLEKNGENYVGDILIYLGNSDEYGRNDASHGSLRGKVRAKVSNGDLLVTIVEAETEAGEYANMFEVLECNLREGDQIFLISYDGTSYTTKAIGKMEYLTDGAEIYTTK